MFCIECGSENKQMVGEICIDCFLKDFQMIEIPKNITVEICNKCHPFYTGQQKILDSEGRVERFNKRYGKKN